MQLFNGLNMGMVKFYRLNFENNPETGNGNAEEINYSEKLNTINQKIDELKKEDTNTENDENAKKELNDILTNSFNVKFVESLDETQKITLKNSIKNVLEAHKNEENFQLEYKWLIDLAKALWVEWYESTEKLDRKLWINWDINDESIQLLEDWKTTDWKFYDKGKKVETPPEWVNTVIENINKQETTLKALLSNDSQYKDNEWLKKANRLLKNIQDIIKNPVDDNVKLLQQYIFDNLDDNMLDESNWNFKETFLKKNKYNESTKQFDWKFWETTLAWLNKVLEKTGKYIDSFKDQPNEWTEEEPFKNVKVKENFSIKWVSSVNAEDLIDGFDGLPDGATAEFKDGKWINIKNLYNDDKKSQEVTVILKIWDKTREITISAGLDAVNQQLLLQEKQNTVWTPERPTNPIDTTPYVDNQWNKYQVMGNSQTIAGRANLHWVTFYAAEAYTGTEPKNGEQWQTFETPANGDYECLMKMWDSVYKVKVDQNWNICPTAVNMMSNVPVVMENSASGKAYIENKLPDALKGKGITIWWDWEDYTISLPWWWKNLTVEPMTIDWKWIWSLTDSLAFLNLTNYLRNSWKMHDIEFKNDNPDLKLEWDELYVKVKRTRDVNWKKISLLKVSKDTFWLPNDEKLLKKYISYNNGEDWYDKRNKKKPNKYYKHVKLQ